MTRLLVGIHQTFSGPFVFWYMSLWLSLKGVNLLMLSPTKKISESWKIKLFTGLEMCPRGNNFLMKDASRFVFSSWEQVSPALRVYSFIPMEKENKTWIFLKSKYRKSSCWQRVTGSITLLLFDQRSGYHSICNTASTTAPFLVWTWHR